MKHASIGSLAEPPDGRASDLRRVRDAWAEYSDSLAWSHWATLTFRRACGRDAALRAFVHGFVRRLARSAQCAVLWFVAVERSGPGAPWHIHALLYGTGALTNEAVRRAWKLGHSDVQRCRAGGGAARYVTKAVRDDDAWWDVSRRRPPSRCAA